MKREKLLRSKEYIVAQMQLNLLNIIEDYKKSKNLKDYQLADELGVSKGYVSQILNATFDHKISKVVDLALACNKMPLIYFVDINKFIKTDAEDKIFELMPMQRPRSVGFSEASNDIISNGFTKISTDIMNNLPILNDISGNEVELKNISGEKPTYQMYQSLC